MEWISIKIPGDLTPKLRGKLRGSTGSTLGRASVPFQQQCPQLEPSTLGRGIQLVLSGSMGGTMEVSATTSGSCRLAPPCGIAWLPQLPPGARTMQLPLMQPELGGSTVGWTKVSGHKVIFGDSTRLATLGFSCRRARRGSATTTWPAGTVASGSMGASSRLVAPWISRASGATRVMQLLPALRIPQP